MTAGRLTKLLGAIALGGVMAWTSGARASLVLEVEAPFAQAGNVITAPANGETAIMRLKATDVFPPPPGSAAALSLTLWVALVQLPPGLVFDPLSVIPGAETNPFGWPFYSAGALLGEFIADFAPWSPPGTVPGTDPAIVAGTRLFAFEFGFAPEAAGLVVEITGELVGWTDLPGGDVAATFVLEPTRLEVLAIPEPGTISLLLGGLILLAGLARRRLPSGFEGRLGR
jgi:hypothetical protein